MSYSNRIKVHELEPIYDSTSNRTEFRFQPDKIYSTNVLLANLGIDQTTGSEYNRLVGSAGMIENIQLMDGNTVLQMTRSTAHWVAWKMLRKSNADLTCVQPLVSGNEAGVKFSGADRAIAGIEITGKQINRAGAPAGDVQQTKTSKTHIPCNMMLPILNAMKYIDTSVFRNLKIVVEYEMTGIIKNNQNEVQSTQRPLLVVEEVVDDSQVASMKGKQGSFEFDNIETDRHFIPAITGITDNSSASNQSKSFHLNGFNNKKVGRVLMVKTTTLPSNTQTGNTDYQNGIYDSMGLFKETTQLRVNGINVFAKGGITKDNQRLARCVDAWGSGAIPPFSQGLAYRSPDAKVRSALFNGNNGANTNFGYISHFGADLGGTLVNDWHVEFGRTGVFPTGGSGVAVSKYNQEYKLQFFVLTKKAIVMNGSSYNVTYL